MSQNQNTVYVGNLSEQVTEDLLYELFLQAGPVEHVNIPKQKPFGFVRFKHQCSVPYVLSLLEGISLFGKTLKVAPPRGLGGPPMGLSHNMAPIVERPLNNPWLQRGSMEPRNSRKGSQRNGENNGSDLRDKLKSRSRPKDPMMPSSRHKTVETPSQKEMDAIPDFLGGGFDPLYSSGTFVAPYQLDGRDDREWSNHNHSRREPNEHGGHHGNHQGNHHGSHQGNQHRRERNEGHRRSHHGNPRRDHSPHHSSSRRKNY